MIEPCDPYLEAFAKAGADHITIHAEATTHLDRSLQEIRALGKKAGVALNPATPESAIVDALDRIDLILVMTVNPGFGGQAFIPAMLDKVAQVKRMIGSRRIDIEVARGEPRRQHRAVADQAPAPMSLSRAPPSSKAARRLTRRISRRSGQRPEGGALPSPDGEQPDKRNDEYDRASSPRPREGDAARPARSFRATH